MESKHVLGLMFVLVIATIAAVILRANELSGEAVLECGNKVCEPGEAKTCPGDCDAPDKELPAMAKDQPEIDRISAAVLIIAIAVAAFLLFYYDKIGMELSRKLKSVKNVVRGRAKKY